MRCTFCSNDTNIPVKKNEITEHLIITKDASHRFHVHGPVDDKDLMEEFISKAQI